jgi:TonB family protein
MARKEAPKKSSMVRAAGSALVVILAIGGYMIFRNHQQAGTGTNQQVATSNIPQPEQQEKTLAPQAQAQLNSILQAKAEFDAAVGAQNRGDLQGALQKFQAIAEKPGTYQLEAKARIPKLNEMINNAGAQEEYNAALQAENSGSLQGALAQFKAIAGKPGPMQSEAQQRVQSITDQISQQQAQQQFNAADQAQKNGDLKGGLAQFRALAEKPGPMQAQAQARVEQITAELRMPAAPPTPASTPTPSPASIAPHNPVVTPLYSGAFRPLTLPYRKGMTVADVNVDGGLKPTNLAMAPVQGAPPGSLVMMLIKIDENGSVTPDRVINDTSGFGPQVQEAARAWKFNPPTAKGKPVNTTLTVKVTF